MTIAMFEGQRICVVGGTAGIGLAVARYVALEDADVVIAGRDEAKAARIAAGMGLNVEGRAVDVMDESSIEQFFQQLGPIEHLVVTAAQVRGGAFKTGPLSSARYSMEGKFWSQYLCARHAQVSRSIVLFSGILSRRPMVGTSIVGAINGAIEALGRSLALELAPVRVNVVSPGLIQGTEAYAAMSGGARDAMIEGASQRLPARIVGDGDSVAGIVCALMSSSYATGGTIDVDGGGMIA